jgi:GGDEF domain-containing protein
MSPLRSVEDPRMPYRVLTAILLGSAVVALLLAFAPGSATVIRGLDSVVGALLAAAGLLLWRWGDRLPGGLALDLGVMVGIVVATIGALRVPTAAGQVLIGMGYVLFGVFIGYFRPPRRIAILLGIMFGGYLGATLANRRLDTYVDFILICAVILAVTVMVARLAGELRALSLRDSLTGVLNRRGLDLIATPLAAASARAGRPITVGIIDIDSFKAFNDEHGHLAGDAALVSAVTAWLAQLRSADVLARYGGDEFALVLPGARREDAEELAVRLAAAHPLPWTGGFVEWTPQEDLYAALGRADDLMYDRKPKRG